MRRIKTAFDPDGILNPGALLDAEPVDVVAGTRPETAAVARP